MYSRNNLSKIKVGTYIINFEYELIGAHWITLYLNDNNVKYFDSFGVENIPKKKNRKFIGNKNIITNISRVQAYDAIMCRYFCIGFIDFALKSKSLLEYSNVSSPNDYGKIDKIILKYFQ